MRDFLRRWFSESKPTEPEVRSPRIAPASMTVTAGVFVREPSDELKAIWSEATSAAAGRDYPRAVSAMNRVLAIQTEEDGEPVLGDEIRRCKYLQYADRGEEAWEAYSRLVKRHQTNDWAIIDLFDAMRLHLQREGDPERGIRYGVAHRLARVQLYQRMKSAALKPASRETPDWLNERLRNQFDEDNRLLQQSDLKLAERWLSELTDKSDVDRLAGKLCRAAKVPDQTGELCACILSLILAGDGPFAYLAAEGEWRT